eukprot:9474146-Pyramimonas_sp.AAC.1
MRGGRTGGGGERGDDEGRGRRRRAGGRRGGGEEDEVDMGMEGGNNRPPHVSWPYRRRSHGRPSAHSGTAYT